MRVDLDNIDEAGALLAGMAAALLSEDPKLQQVIVPAPAKEEASSEISAADEGVVLLDESGAIVACDSAAAAIFRVAERDVMGKDASAIFTTAEEGARPFAVRPGKGGAPALDVRPDLLGRRRSGGPFPLELRTSAITLDGQPRFLLRVRDLIEKRKLEEPARRAEARYRALVEQIPAVTFMAALDDGFNEIYVSPQIEQLLGFSQREWLDDPVLWFKRLHPDDQDLWNREFSRGIAAGGPFRAECRLIARDGRTVWILGEARLVRDELGRPLLLQGIAFDITELKRAEQQIRDAQEAKTRHERLAAVGRLAASIGHDIRNPLAAIGNAYYYLRKRIERTDLGAEERVDQLLDVLEKELKSCTRIVGDLLDYARERPQELTLCPLASLVTDALSVVPVPAHVTVVNRVPETLPVLEIDRDQFRQILVNLIQNAAEAIPPERDGRVTVNAIASDGAIVLTVADNGNGIADENLEKIFEPLFTSKAKGTGLGLSIVASHVARHGGTVDVESRRGEGTTFTLRVPLRGPKRPAGPHP